MSVNGIGRKLTYTEELGDEICLAVSTSSKGLAHLCKANPHWPCYQTIFEWRIKVKSFGEKYDKAKRDQIEFLIDETLEIADNTFLDTITKENKDGSEYETCNAEWIARSRLRVDTRKWLASKLAPKIYGDKIQQDSTVTVKHEDAIRELE